MKKLKSNLKLDYNLGNEDNFNLNQNVLEKSKFKSNFILHNISSDLLNDNKNDINQNNQNELEGINEIQSENINKGTPKEYYFEYENEIKSEDMTRLVLKFFEIPNIFSDYSYHWIEKYENIRRILLPNGFILKENYIRPKRDIKCEYELLKLLTEDEYHKSNMINFPRSLKKMNRYSDVIPCKLKLILNVYIDYIIILTI